MKHFCESASEKGFIRVHRSFAIQYTFINNIAFEESGDGTAILLDGTEVAISRRYKESLKSRLTPS